MTPNPLLEGVAGNFFIRAISHFFLWVIGRLIRLLKRSSPFKLVTLCLNHRQPTRHRFEEAFVSGQDVLFITIMSQHTVKQIRPLLKKALDSNTRLRVLTLYPDLAHEAIEALRKHLDENRNNPERTVVQVKEASVDWDNLAVEHNNIEVRKYRSSPTMQGLVVGKEWAQVELLPFATHPDYRPALILTAASDPEAFELFRGAFENLWNSAQSVPLRETP